jgi:glycosyltransferase involved in cell wall biosynthesis
MNVLLLTQVLPYPPDSGPKVKTYNVLKYLTREHKVTLVSFVRGDQSADVVCLQRYCQAIYTVPMERGVVRDGLAMARSLLIGQPWMMVRDDRGEMRRLVDHLLAETSFNVVHADQLNMAQYALRVCGASKVLDAHNALWLLYRRLAARMKPGPGKWLLERDWRLLKAYEGQMVRVFDAVLAVSQEDREALLEAAGVERPITIIPIAVDMDEVRPAARRPGANHILHLGTMYWPPNIDGVMWFIHEVFPHIRQHRPDVVFDVVGSRPPSALRELSQDGSGGINVTGYVADPAPYLEQAGVFVVPLRAGGGMRVKILNALAQGLPVVSTALGVEGIAAVPGRDLLTANTAETFAEAVIQVLNDPALAARLSAAGRRLIEQTYDYRVACRPLEEVYR